MKCFNHHDRDAFGICTICGKGLCLECIDKQNNTISCKNSACSQKLKQQNLWRIILYIVLFFAIILLIID